ncbi:MAG: NAD(P)-dependent alcohol dehydrogenase [Deltaproteobacteria bacterium]|nr:NAD(P)-dependent alcohol dehydrogenase [Deltaproteobacteria bacterium]
MKTVYRTHYGPSHVLSVKDVPIPTPKDNELLVRVRAATVNRTDCSGLSGRPFVYRFFAGFPRPRFVATGTDFAGDVEAVGKSVSHFKVSDRIWGLDDNGLGSHAQYFILNANKPIAKIPEGVSYEHAVASAEGAHYALNFIKKVPLQAGQKVLVNGGTGAIGSAAIQLLKHKGLRVTAVCAGPHMETVRALGAERVIDYLTQDFVEALAPQAADDAFDFVFDAVGKSTFGRCKPLMKPGAVYLSSELGPHAQNIWLALAAPVLSPFSARKKVIFPVPFDVKGSLAFMTELLQQGAFVPLIDRRFAMEQIADAFDYVQSGQKIGNVLLTME